MQKQDKFSKATVIGTFLRKLQGFKGMTVVAMCNGLMTDKDCYIKDELEAMQALKNYHSGNGGAGKAQAIKDTLTYEQDTDTFREDRSLEHATSVAIADRLTWCIYDYYLSVVAEEAMLTPRDELTKENITKLREVAQRVLDIQTVQFDGVPNHREQLN